MPERYDFCGDKNKYHFMKTYFFVVLSLVSCCLKVQAQTTDTTKLNEVVIAENRFKTSFKRVARNIQVISKAEIAALPVRSVNEALLYVVGVDVRQRGPFGTQADVSVDGGTFEQTLILLNGVKLSDAQTAHHAMNIPVPLAAVERIEILKGPAARVYGVNALTGAINIVTIKPTANSLLVNVQAGSSFIEKEVGDGDGVYGGTNVEAALQMANASGTHLFAFGNTAYNGQRYNSAATHHKFYYQNQLSIDTANTVEVMAGYIGNQFGANGYYAAPGDKEAFEVVNTGLLSVSSSHQFGDAFTLKPRVSYRKNWDDYRYYRNDLARGRSMHETGVFTAEVNSLLQTNVGAFGFGLEHRVEDIESTSIGLRERYNNGGYVEYKYDAIAALMLNVGGYINYNSVYGWQFFPGVDVGYTLAEGLKLMANIGSSQRIPSFTDLYLNQKPGNIGNDALVSENAWQYGAYLSLEKYGFLFTGGYFYRNIENFIDWVRVSSVNPYQPQNFRQNKMQGWSVNLSQTLIIAPAYRLSYQLNYQYLLAGTHLANKQLISKYALSYLKKQAIARFTLHAKQLSLTAAGRWIERMAEKDYFVADMRLACQQNGYQFYAESTNLLNAKYIETGAVPLPTRWFSVGASLRFGL